MTPSICYDPLDLLQGATRLEPLGDQNEVQGADARPRVSELSAAGTQPGAAGSPPV